MYALVEDSVANGDGKVEASKKHKMVVIGGRHGSAQSQSGQNHMQFVDYDGSTCSSCLANIDIHLPFGAYSIGSAYSDGILAVFGGKPGYSGPFNGNAQFKIDERF